MNVTGLRFGFIPPHGFAGDLAVVCPGCRSRAVFTPPYGYLYVRDPQDVAPGLRCVRAYEGFVVERFPDVFPWRDPHNPWQKGRGTEDWGVVSCPACGRRRKHRLNWPADAFYKTDLSVGRLWAYSRDHLLQIRRHVVGDRSARRGFDMNRVPKAFILVRNRARVRKAIDGMLARPEVRIACAAR
jgi:hypothetical protein